VKTPSHASKVQIQVFAKDDEAVCEAEDQILDIIDQHREVLPVVIATNIAN